MTEIVPIVPQASKGNTVPSQPAPSLKWVFTLNNYTDNEYDKLIEDLNSSTDRYIVGKEVGEEGTPHLQGYAQFKNKIRLTGLKKINDRIHWEKCKGSEEDNAKYCSKEGKAVAKGIAIIKPLKLLDKSKFYFWQKEVMKIIEEDPDDRKIYWLWEEKGNTGKTTFSKYLSYYHGAVPIEGKKNDILFCAASFPSNIYIMDLERSMEEYVSYGAIEKIKNGYYMCSKYESKPIVRNPPHMIIFANFPPDITALSSDRWVIRDLNMWTPDIKVKVVDNKCLIYQNGKLNI
ncbi:MAG: putative viral replication protein [Cressdnaviricota sp.]|nr:MAG: putative viral replication protein [Cressdnaviricota sp.]